VDAVNLQVRMRRRPSGMVDGDDFDLVRAPVPSPGTGQVLVRNEWLSLDPYQRTRMDAERTYVDPMQVGDLMPGGTVGVVLESRADEVPVGATVAAWLGWQTYGVADRAAVRVLDPGSAPPSAALGVLGMTGVTAHYGVVEIGRAKAAETVLVTAASGAVGSVAGQIAKILGCRAVGVAGGERKCRYVVEELGFDACVDYKAPDFGTALAAATPDGVDVLFENVGGPVMDAAIGRLNDFARIAFCGNVSQYNETEPYGLKRVRDLLMRRVTLQAFVIADRRDYWPAALADLTRWRAEGRLRGREDVAEGLENAPAAFVRMLTGGNLGKQLVHIR
jgi:NADPH-dependent curcumin reductase CurA